MYWQAHTRLTAPRRRRGGSFMALRSFKDNRIVLIKAAARLFPSADYALQESSRCFSLKAIAQKDGNIFTLH
jgi:hypothetical protein